MPRSLALLALLAATSGSGCGRDRDPNVLRIGHFPNLTHAHGLVAHHRSREGRGWIEERLPPGIRVEWYVYKAGPSAMEALLAGSLDLAYVGPSPALNTYIRSEGTEVRVLRGATRGGAALLVQGGGGIRSPSDFRGRRVASPQLGNTQDVALRAWLKGHGLRVTQTGGDLSVIPTPNPEQLALFKTGDLDAVWTVEPWVSRIEMEANGKVFLEDAESLTTVLVGAAEVVRDRPDVVRKVSEAHDALTAWMREHPDEARAEALAELKEESRVEVSADLAARAWKRLRFDDAVTREEFEKFVRDAQDVGFLEDAVPLDRLVVPR
jgi:NitT/TauT family transport system substrate-binding protein